MSRALIVAGLLIDSWRDQSPYPESAELVLPGDASPLRRFRGTSDDGAATPRLASLIALAAAKWEPR